MDIPTGPLFGTEKGAFATQNSKTPFESQISNPGKTFRWTFSYSPNVVQGGGWRMEPLPGVFDM